jgi:hypothetical protein
LALNNAVTPSALTPVKSRKVLLKEIFSYKKFRTPAVSRDGRCVRDLDLYGVCGVPTHGIAVHALWVVVGTQQGWTVQ